ncbi:hypothetical protein GT037_010054 [Alternaria burnsii]|uniref:Uncharacterized protein n=1 Tax=Alternaria burnsii TaxID=1187904 RepID=A0A8H7AYT7_9PLEO|nr:uncharacterized protein GT037_010054 [Alternaria burnsii]KAF7671831.1 hypothetical protein GT037_010054 [Alternaria burnsii]
MLVANIFSHNSNHTGQLLSSWHPVGLSSAALFHHVLANSLNFLVQNRNGRFPSRNDHADLTRRQRAFRCTIEMMKDSLEHKSDGMIRAVVSTSSRLVRNE